MGDAAKWLVLGLLGGFGVGWVWDWLVWRRQVLALPSRSELARLEDEVGRLGVRAREAEGLGRRVEELRVENERLAALAAEAGRLRAELGAAREALAAGVTGASTVGLAGAVGVGVGLGGGLEGVGGISDEQRGMLAGAGLGDLAALAGASEEAVLSAVGAMPWDDVDAGGWIAQARAILEGLDA